MQAIKLFGYLKSHWFLLVTIGILCLAAFLRFYDYGPRWGLAYDQSHDVLVAREALRQHKLPMLGPFSSAGPFVTGPEWYWFIMLGVLIFPQAIITPWIFLTVLSIFFVYLMMVIGKYMGGYFFAVCIGLLAAVSSAEISQGINLTNQAPLTLLCAASMFAIIKYFQNNNMLYLFLNGLFVSLGINTHLQGVLLIPLFVLPYLFDLRSIEKSSKLFLKKIFVGIVGFILPCIPLIIFDSTHHFYDLRHMWQYYRYDQYNVSLDILGRNWKNYLGIFWPQSFANILGGNIILAYLFMSFTIVLLFLAIYKKKITKVFLIVLLSLCISIIFLRYTRTPLFDSYLMFLHPWIFIVAAWTITFVYSKNRNIAYIILACLVAGSIVKDKQDMDKSLAANTFVIQPKKIEQILVKKFPHQKFSLYDFHYATTFTSVPLSLELDGDTISNKNGLRIGLKAASTSAEYGYPVITEQNQALVLLTLQSLSITALQRQGWVSVNPSSIYHATEEWYNDRKL